MKLELISHPHCPYVHRAAIMLGEKGVPFERRVVDLTNKPEWFLAISPRGKVPVLVADGQPLFESAAICEFLDETTPPALLPPDPFERARQRGWVEVANDLLVGQYKALVATDPTELEKARAAVDSTLGRLEEAMQSKVISETGFGLVHVALAPALQRFVILADARRLDLLARYPRVAALAKVLAGRRSVADTVPFNFATEWVAGMVARKSLLLS